MGCGGVPLMWVTISLATSRSLMLRWFEAARRISNASVAEHRFWPMMMPIAWSMIEREAIAVSRCRASWMWSVTRSVKRQRA